MMVTLVFNELKVGFRTLERITIIFMLQGGFFLTKGMTDLYSYIRGSLEMTI